LCCVERLLADVPVTSSKLRQFDSEHHPTTLSSQLGLTLLSSVDEGSSSCAR